MSSSSPQRRPPPWIIIVLILIIVVVIILFAIFQPSEEEASSQSRYASGWSVKNNADWTPPPPSANPLGAPNATCTGGVIANSWAHFTFPATSLPSGATVSGVEIRLKYLSASGTNTVQLTRGGTLIGSAKTVASVSGPSNCASTTFTAAGGNSDTWGSGASAADFNSGAIGVRLTQKANTVDLDAVELNVFYTP